MTEELKTLKWGIIGAGNIAHKMADALQQRPLNTLKAVASKSPQRALAFAKAHGDINAYSYAELVNDPEIDLVYIATTHNFHYENAVLALEHGKHVLIEKPFTVNADQARKLVDLARKRDRFLMEAIWTRFLPSFQLLHKQLQQGVIGEVKLMSIHFGGFTPPHYAERLRDPELAGGVTLDMGIYPITFACYMLDSFPSEVKSMARFSDRGVDEVATYNFRFPSGCFAQISTSFNLLMKNEAVIYGSTGFITFPNFLAGDRFTISHHGGSKVISHTEEMHKAMHDNGFVYQVDGVELAIAAGRRESREIPLAETVATMELMDNMRAEWGLRYPGE